MFCTLQIATENEISLLTRGSPLSKAGPEAWTSHPAEYDEEEEVEEVKVTHVKFLPPPVREPSPERGESESGSSVQEVDVVTALPSTLPGRLSLGLETSQASVLSTDTTLEFHDAPLPEDLEMEALQQPANEVTDEEEEDDEVVVNLKTQAVLEAPLSKEEVQPAAANELTLLLSLEEGQNKDPEVKEEAVNSEVELDHEVGEMEVSPEQEEPKAEKEVVVQPRVTQAVEPTPDTEVVEESNLNQEVIDLPNHKLEVETAEVVEEETPKEDESQPTEPMKPVAATEHTGEGSTHL